jgi:peptide/nickel transport system permease protein
VMRPAIAYATRRIVQALIVLWAAYTLTFVLLSALPGDAISNRVNNPQNQLTPESGRILKAFYGLDRPLWEQYVHMLRALLGGDLGYSITDGGKVSTVLGSALPKTLELTALGFVFAVSICAVVGIAGSYARWQWLRNAMLALPPLQASLPTFVVGILVLQWLSFGLHVIPAVDDGSFRALLAPAVVLGIVVAAPLAQVFVTSLDKTRGEAFVKVLLAKGASERYAFTHDVLRNSALPVLTLLGLAVGELIAGSVVTEAVFARNGIGAVTLNAVNTQDLPVVQAVVLLSTTGYVLVNLVVDLLYPLVDPRILHDDRAGSPSATAVAAREVVDVQPVSNLQVTAS